MSFKFRPEDFENFELGKLSFTEDDRVRAADRANTLLEAHLKTLPRVWILEENGITTAHLAEPVGAQRVALLFDVKEIKETEK